MILNQATRFTERMVYTLKSLNFPPQVYEGFLSRATGVVKEVLLEHYGVDSLDALAKRYVQLWRDECPLTPEGEAENFVTPLSASTSGLVIVSRNAATTVLARPYDSLQAHSVYRLCTSPVTCPGEIGSFVERARQVLDDIFPGRNGAVPALRNAYGVGEKVEFELKMHSGGGWFGLDVRVGIKNHGATMPAGSDDFYASPGLQVEVECFLAEQQELQGKLIQELGNLAHQRYEMTSMESWSGRATI